LEHEFVAPVRHIDRNHGVLYVAIGISTLDAQTILDRFIGKVPEPSRLPKQDLRDWAALVGNIPKGCAAKPVPWSFQTGHRIDLVDASIEYSSNLASDLIVIHTVPVINGLNVAKEYFAISSDRLRLVRMENDNGVLMQNEYVFSVYEIGLVPNAKSVDEWAGA